MHPATTLEQTPATEPAGTREQHLHKVTPVRRVLVAEDNQEMLSLLTRFLRRDGYDVIQARNGLELMHWIEVMVRSSPGTPPIDLIVTDLRMPMYSGQDCLEELRATGNATPCILITAFGDEEVHRAAYAGGATAVFNKPLVFGGLRAAVARALDRPHGNRDGAAPRPEWDTRGDPANWLP